MANRRIEMYEYRQIIHRLRKGQSVRSISRDTKMGRHKITEIKTLCHHHGWLQEVAMPSDEALQQIITGSTIATDNGQRCKCLDFESKIKLWSDEGITAAKIHKHLEKSFNFSGSYNSVQRFIKAYKESQPLKMTIPLHFEPGECAQVDFGSGPVLVDERTGKSVKTWYFVMTLCWSRHQYAQLVTNQNVETWLKCHRDAFDWFGGVVNKVMIDNAKCAVTKASYDSPEIQRSYNEFAECYGFIISACPPRDPQKKGRVEGGVKYIKRGFQPLREFKSLQDANRQLERWVLEEAGNRVHGTTFEKPLNQFEAIERNFLNPLPETKPQLSTWHKVKQYKDCHVRFEKVRYSVPYTLYGTALWLKATPTMVMIYDEATLVATHTRSFKAGECKTLNDHLPPQAQFYLNRTPQWCMDKSQEIGNECRLLVETLLTDPTRDLLRQAQRVIKLADKYTSKRLENACCRANNFNSPTYQTVLEILKSGADYQTLPDDSAFTQLNPVYCGYGQYQRQLNTNQLH